MYIVSSRIMADQRIDRFKQSTTIPEGTSMICCCWVRDGGRNIQKPSLWDMQHLIDAVRQNASMGVARPVIVFTSSSLGWGTLTGMRTDNYQQSLLAAFWVRHERFVSSSGRVVQLSSALVVRACMDGLVGSSIHVCAKNNCYSNCTVQHLGPDGRREREQKKAGERILT